MAEECWINPVFISNPFTRQLPFIKYYIIIIYVNERTMQRISVLNQFSIFKKYEVNSLILRFLDSNLFSTKFITKGFINQKNLLNKHNAFKLQNRASDLEGLDSKKLQTRHQKCFQDKSL